MLTNEMKKEIITRLQKDDKDVSSYLVKDFKGKRNLMFYLAFFQIEMDEDYFDIYHHKVVIIDFINHVAFSSNYAHYITTLKD